MDYVKRLRELEVRIRQRMRSNKKTSLIPFDGKKAFSLKVANIFTTTSTEPNLIILMIQHLRLMWVIIGLASCVSTTLLHLWIKRED